MAQFWLMADDEDGKETIFGAELDHVPGPIRLGRKEFDARY